MDSIFLRGIIVEPIVMSQTISPFCAIAARLPLNHAPTMVVVAVVAKFCLIQS